MDEIRARDRDAAEHIAKSYAPALKVADDLRAVGWSMLFDWDGRGLDKDTVDVLVAAEGARSVKTYAAAVSLLRAGYGEQAAMLHRALFEGMVVAHWVTAEPERALDRYDKHAQHSALLWGDALRNAGWLDEVAAEQQEEPDVGEGAETEAPEGEDRSDLARLFGTYGERGWTGSGLHTLVGKVAHMWDDGGQQVRQHYRIALRASNQTLHATHDALLGPVVADEDRRVLLFEHAPSRRYVGRSLFSTYWTHLQTLGLLRDHFGMQACRDELERLRTVPASAFKRTDQDA